MQKIIIEEIAFVGEVSGKLPRKLTNGISKMTAALEKVGLRRLQLWPFLGIYLKFRGMYHDRPPPKKKISFFPKNDVFFVKKTKNRLSRAVPGRFICLRRKFLLARNVVGLFIPMWSETKVTPGVEGLV